MALGLAALALVVFALAWRPESPSYEPLLVADLRGRALLVVDSAEPEAARPIELPGGPHELLRLPDGRVLVSLEQAGSLAVVDLATGAVETVEVGGVPHGLALDGATVLVTDRGANAVRRFALDGWRELEALPVGTWPHAVGVTPTGEVAVTSAEPGTLSVGGIEAFVGRTTETLAVRGDGAVATASATDGVVAIYASDGALLDWWEVGGRPVRVAFSPDGDTLAVALSAAHEVALITADEVTTVPVEGVPDGLAFTSDGRMLYASDVYGGSVTAVDLAASRAIAVLNVGEATGSLLVLAH